MNNNDIIVSIALLPLQAVILLSFSDASSKSPMSFKCIWCKKRWHLSQSGCKSLNHWISILSSCEPKLPPQPQHTCHSYHTVSYAVHEKPFACRNGSTNVPASMKARSTLSGSNSCTSQCVQSLQPPPSLTLILHSHRRNLLLQTRIPFGQLLPQNSLYVSVLKAL